MAPFSPLPDFCSPRSPRQPRPSRSIRSRPYFYIFGQTLPHRQPFSSDILCASESKGWMVGLAVACILVISWLVVLPDHPAGRVPSGFDGVGDMQRFMMSSNPLAEVYVPLATKRILHFGAGAPSRREILNKLNQYRRSTPTSSPGSAAPSLLSTGSSTISPAYYDIAFSSAASTPGPSPSGDSLLVTSASITVAQASTMPFPQGSSPSTTVAPSRSQVLSTGIPEHAKEPMYEEPPDREDDGEGKKQEMRRSRFPQGRGRGVQ